MSTMDRAFKDTRNEATTLPSTPEVSSKHQRKWDTSLLNWVKCILGPDSFTSLSCEALYALIKHFENVNGGKSDECSDESVFRFLKKEYPYFRYGTLADVAICPEDVILIISLLLHYSCVKSKDITIRGNMCKSLDVIDQKAIAMFANNLMRHENITERNLLNAMKAISVENKYEESFDETSTPLQMKRDPLELPGSKPNMMSPLLQTPLRKSRKVFHLEAELGAERFDRNFLQEEVDRLHRRISELEKLEKSYEHEMQRLRGELSVIQDVNKENLLESVSCDHCKYKDKILQDELRSHELEVLRLLSNIHNLEEQKDLLNMKLKEAENAVSVWSSQAIYLENAESSLRTQISEMGCKISDLEIELSYTKQCLKEYNKDRNLNCSIECDDDSPIIKKKLNYSLMSSSENLGETVIDVQLKEQISKNEAMSFHLDKILKENERLNIEFQKLETLNATMMDINQTLKEENEKYSFKLQYMDELEVQYKECKVNLDSKIGVIDKLNTEIETLSKGNNSLQKEIEKSELNICTLNETIKKLNESIKNFMQKCDDMDILHVRYSDENNNLKETCENKSKEIESLTREITSYEKLVNGYEIQIDDYKQEMKNKESQLNGLNIKCQELEDKINSLSMDVIELNDEKLKLDNILSLQQDQINECNVKIQANEEKLKTIFDENCCMLNKLSNAENNLKIKTQELNNCSADYMKVIEESVSLKNLIETQENTIEKIIKEKDVLVSETISLNESYENAKKELMKLKHEITEKYNISEQIKSENLELTNIVNGQKIEMEKNRAELALLNNKLIEDSNIKRVLETKLEETETSLKLKIMEITETKHELKEMSIEIAHLKTENSCIDTLNESIDNLKQKYSNLEKSQNQILDENNNLKETCKNKIKEMESYEKLVSEYKIQIGDCKLEMDSKESQLNELNKKCNELEDKVNSLSTAITDLTDEKLKMDKFVCLQKDQIDEFQANLLVKEEKLKEISIDNCCMLNKLSNAESNLKIKTQELNNCSADYMKVVEESVSLKNLIESQENTIKKMIKEKDILVSKTMSSKKSYEKINLKLIKLEEEITEKDNNSEKIKCENLELTNIVKSQKMDVEKNKTELTVLNNKLIEVSNIKRVLETKLEKTETSLNLKIMEITEMKNELKEMSIEIAHLKTENSCIDTLNESIDNLKQKYSNLEKSQNQILDENNNLKETCENKIKEMESLTKEITSYEKLVCDYKHKMKNKESQLNDLNKKCQELEDKVNSLSMDVIELNDEKFKLDNFVYLQQEQINKHNAIIQVNEEKLKTIFDENCCLLKKLSDAENNLKVKIQEFNNCSADYMKVIEESASLKNLIETQENTIEKIIKEKDVLVSETISLNESYEYTKKELMKLKHEITEKYNISEQIKSENLELTNVVNGQKIEMEKNRAELAVLNNKLIEDSNIKRVLETKLEETETSLNLKIMEITETKHELKEMSIEIAHLKTENSWIKTLNESINNLKQKCGNLEILRDQISDENNNLKETCENKIKEMESLTKEITSYEKLVCDYKIQIDDYKHKMNNKEIQLNVLNKKCNELEDKVNSLSIAITDLTDEKLKLDKFVCLQEDQINEFQANLQVKEEKLKEISDDNCCMLNKLSDAENNLKIKTQELNNLSADYMKIVEESVSLKNLIESQENTIKKMIKEKDILVSETISSNESYEKINLELIKLEEKITEKDNNSDKLNCENLELNNIVNSQKMDVEKNKTELAVLNNKLLQVSNIKRALETKLEETESSLNLKIMEITKTRQELNEMSTEVVHLRTENSNLHNLLNIKDKQKGSPNAQFSENSKKVDSFMDVNHAMELKLDSIESDSIIKTHECNVLIERKDRRNYLFENQTENKENFDSNDVTIKSKLGKKLTQKMCDFLSKEFSKNRQLDETLSISTKYCENSINDTKPLFSCTHKLDMENLVRKIMKQLIDCENNCLHSNESFKYSKTGKSDVSFTSEDENLSFEVFDTDILQYHDNNKTFTRFDEFEDYLLSDDASNDNLKMMEKTIPLQSHSTELIAKTCAQNILIKEDLILNLKNKCEILNKEISNLSSINEKLRIENETLLISTKNDNTDISFMNSDELQKKFTCKYCLFKCTNACCSRDANYLENREENDLTKELITSTTIDSSHMNPENLKLYFDFPNTPIKDEGYTKTILKKIFHLISKVEVDLLMKSEKDIIDCSSLESSTKNNLEKENCSINGVNLNIENLISDKEFLTTEPLHKSIIHIYDTFESIVDECTNLKNKLKSCENENTVFKQQFHNISQVMKNMKEEIGRYEADSVAIISSQAEMNNKYINLSQFLKQIKSEMLLCFEDENILKNISDYHLKFKNICRYIKNDLNNLNQQIFNFTSFKNWLYCQFEILTSSDLDVNSRKIENKSLESNSHNFEILNSIKKKFCDADLLLKEYKIYSSRMKNVIENDMIFNEGKDMSMYEQIHSISTNYKSLQNDIAHFKKKEKISEDNVRKIKEDYDVLIQTNQKLLIESNKLQKNLRDKESQVNSLAVDKANMQSIIESKEALSSINIKLTMENTKLKENNEILTIKLNDVNMRMYSENVKPLIDFDNMLQENLKLVDMLKQIESEKRQIETEYASIKNIYNQLVIEHKNLKTNGTQENVNSLIVDLKNEYEDKLSRMKIKMKQLYQEQISVYVEKQKEELTRSELLCKKYADKIKSYESHVNQLSSELWKVGEKLLMERNEKDWLKHQLKERFGSRQSLQFASSTVDIKLRQTCSVLKVFDDSVKDIINESIGKNIPKRIQAESGGLHMSDEEGEIFDNTYLADLKSGICEPRFPSKSNRDKNMDLQPNRLSELQWRNSLCLPHLKSSYPAETQFQKFKEEDIKLGAASIDDEKASRPKKEVGQTTYKKPGPPTPSKKGGRLSLQGNDMREPLKEQNDIVSKKATTPSRIRSLFMGNSSRSTLRDENTFGTPKGKRLSIFRKPR